MTEKKLSGADCRLPLPVSDVSHVRLGEVVEELSAEGCFAVVVGGFRGEWSVTLYKSIFRGRKSMKAKLQNLQDE